MIKGKDNCNFGEASIIEKNEIVILIGPTFTYGYLFFWDFYKKELLHQMKLDSGISDICLWDNNYIFASLINSDSQFVLIDLNNYTIKKKYEAEDEVGSICGIKVIKKEFSKSFLISSSMKGLLDLYSLEN